MFALDRRWVWGVGLTHFALCERKVSMFLTLYSPTFIDRTHSGHGVELS